MPSLQPFAKQLSGSLSIVISDQLARPKQRLYSKFKPKLHVKLKPKLNPKLNPKQRLNPKPKLLAQAQPPFQVQAQYPCQAQAKPMPSPSQDLEPISNKPRLLLR